MDKNRFMDMVKTDENSVICIDFDGVIHKSSKGYHDGTIYDEPVIGTFEALKKIYESGFKIVISSCKCNPDRPLVNNKTGIELMWEWLDKYLLSQYVNDIVYGKPNALAYIDDKGIRFKDWNQVFNNLEELKINV